MSQALPRSRRLRKKLYVGEFAVLGFSVSCQMGFSDEAQLDTFLDDFAGFLETRELMYGGGGNVSEFSGYVTAFARYGSATQDDIDSVKAWLESYADVSSVTMGELSDANYGNW